MTSRENDRKIEKIMREIVDSILEASDQEILEDAAVNGEDVERTVTEFRVMVDDLLQQRRKASLERSQSEWESHMLKDRDVDAALPANADERRSLLERAIEYFQGSHDLRLTLQFRDFRELSDDDVTSHLRKLIALNVPLDELDRMEADGDET